MKNKKIVQYALITSVVLNIFLLWYGWSFLGGAQTPQKQSKDMEALSRMKEQKPPLVTVAIAKQEPIARVKTFSGTIKAGKVISIVSEVAGRVKKINFKQGESVQKDQILIQIEDEQVQAQLKEAQAHVRLAQSSYQRQKQLFAQNYGSKAALEKAEAELASALAAAEKARISLTYTVIRAPFEGEIGLTDLSVGSQVHPNQDITRLVSSNPMEVEFQVAEAEVKYIKKGQEVSVLAEGYDTLSVQAHVSAISPYSHATTHTIAVKALMPNPENLFRDGAFAHVTVALSSDENAIVIPKEAVFREGDTDYVYIFVNERAAKRDVIVGMSAQDRVQITHGIEPGDQVITDPVDLLVDDIKVRVDTSH